MSKKKKAKKKRQDANVIAKSVVDRATRPGTANKDGKEGS